MNESDCQTVIVQQSIFFSALGCFTHDVQRACVCSLTIYFLHCNVMLVLDIPGGTNLAPALAFYHWRTTGLLVCVYISLSSWDAVNILWRHPLPSMSGFTRALSSSTRKFLLLLRFPQLYTLLIPHYIANSLNELTWMMCKIMTKCLRTVSCWQL